MGGSMGSLGSARHAGATGATGHGSFGERAARLRLARQVSYGVSTLNSVDGDANVAEYDVFRSTSLQLVVSACSSFQRISASNDALVVSGSCSLTGSEIAIIELSNGATVTLNRPFTFGVVALKPGATFKVLAPVTITGNFAAEGTIDIDGFDVTVGSVGFTTDSVYVLAVKNLSPGIIKSLAGAAIGGTMVIRLPTDAGVGVGAAFPSLTFGQFSGLFDAVFVVQEVGRSGRRSLLQATGATTSCSNANGACTTTIINAAGADDDDEVPFVVALIIVSLILFVGIVAAVYIYSKRKNGDKQTPQPVRAAATNNATAYGAAKPSSSSDYNALLPSSSSSSSSSTFFAPAYGAPSSSSSSSTYSSEFGPFTGASSSSSSSSSSTYGLFTGASSSSSS